MRFDSPKLRFECGNKQVDIDVVDAQIRLEGIQEDYGSTEGSDRDVIDTTNVLQGVKDWFKDDYDMAISSADAWAVMSRIGFAFADYKKKLSLMLVSDSGITSTQPESRSAWSSFWTGCFPSSKRKRKSETELEQRISDLIASGNL